jgi:hypothetical protein
MSSLPDDGEPFQKRMSFCATDVPSLPTVNTTSPSTSQATIDKLKLFGSRFSSLMTRQAAPTFTKLTTQGTLTCSSLFSHENSLHALAKLLPINETVSSLLKVIGESPSLIRSTAMRTGGVGDDGRVSPTIENSRKRILQEKFDQRKKDLCSTHCQSKVFLLPASDLTVVYVPINESNN